MARTIAQTRADVAEIKPDAAPGDRATGPEPAAATDIFAAAERLQDMAWTMRERGLDMSTCDQINELAGAILSASSLRDPGDQRAQKLGEVLKYLERRVDTMLALPPVIAASALRAGTETRATPPAAMARSRASPAASRRMPPGGPHEGSGAQDGHRRRSAEADAGLPACRCCGRWQRSCNRGTSPSRSGGTRSPTARDPRPLGGRRGTSLHQTGAAGRCSLVPNRLRRAERAEARTPRGWRPSLSTSCSSPWTCQ